MATVLVYLYFARVFSSKEKKLSTTEILLITLGTVSIFLQTQGLADLNIQVLPTLLGAIIAIFKRKYFLSGLLMGVTISIKWQPAILLPLFGATIFYFSFTQEKIKHSLTFLVGLLPVPIVSWILVLIHPGGLDAFKRATEYLIHGAPMLSGQALNLNWIVTYILHAFSGHFCNTSSTYCVESLDHLGGLNRQIGSSISPKIFQGYLFMGAYFVIMVKYWLLEKKNIANFLSASVMIYFSHFMLNKSAYEKHIFYVTAFMICLYLVRPSKENRRDLILFDLMTVINLIMFYGFLGPKDIQRLVFGYDITVLLSTYYFFVYIWYFKRYLERKNEQSISVASNKNNF